MALHELSSDDFSPVPRVAFSDVGVRERPGLQRILRDRINIIVPDLMVIAEECSDWVDCKRRIDLLGLDKTGALVVIEVKRTSDGGHMELQALRYAAMISAITFDRLVEIHNTFLVSKGQNENALQLILSHLGFDSAEDVVGIDRVRIVLVSADFSREITTTVLWLNEQGLDITCVRLVAYDLRGTTLVDVQQVIPLPEAQDYTVRMKEKQREIRAVRTQSRDFSRYRITCGNECQELNKRRAILAVVVYLSSMEVSPEQMQETLALQRKMFFQVPGNIASEEDFIDAVETTTIPGEPRFDEGRWFTADDELIHFGGNTYAFNNQWGKNTEEKMRNLIQAHGDGRVSVERL